MTRVPMARLLVGIASLLAVACTQEPKRDPGVPLEAEAGKSVRGSPLHYWVFGDEGPVVAFIGSMRGDATAGTPLLMETMAFLLVRPHLMRGRRALFVPFLNPDGVKFRRRGNANGVDLDRDWPDPSQPESRALRELLRRYPPTLIVDIRQPGSRVVWTGDAGRIARRMARRTGMPAVEIDPPPNTFAAWAKAPVITLELPRAADSMTDWLLFERYGGALLYALFGHGRLG